MTDTAGRTGVGTSVAVLYRLIDRMHLFTSSEVKGLCAGCYDLAEAHAEVGVQLQYIAGRREGATLTFEPETRPEDLVPGELARWVAREPAKRIDP